MTWETDRCPALPTIGSGPDSRNPLPECPVVAQAEGAGETCHPSPPGGLGCRARKPVAPFLGVRGPIPRGVEVDDAAPRVGDDGRTVSEGRHEISLGAQQDVLRFRE